MAQTWNNDAIFYLKNNGFGPKFKYVCLCRTGFVKSLVFTASRTWMSLRCHPIPEVGKP